MKTKDGKRIQKKWYATKTLFRISLEGPGSKETLPCGEMFEERIVLIQAESYAKAEIRAIKEARSFEKITFRHPFGRFVKYRLMKLYEIYEIDEPIEDGVEVFFVMGVIPETMEDDELIAARFGHEEGEKEDKIRKKIFGPISSLEDEKV